MAYSFSSSVLLVQQQQQLGNCVSPPRITTTIPNKVVGINNNCTIRGGMRPSCVIRSKTYWNRRNLDNTSQSNLPSEISPWIILSPSFDENGNNMVYNFYSLKDDKVISINKRQGNDDDDYPSPADDSVWVGSSHGWLALYNRRSHDVFLSNPLTRRHIKLPSIHNLRDINLNAKCVQSVILSAPADDKECVALMIYGINKSLAFCHPSSTTSCCWTTIGKSKFIHFASVYSTAHKLFYSLNQYTQLEVFNLVDPDLYIINAVYNEWNFPWPFLSDEDYLFKSWKCHTTESLVVVLSPDPSSSSTEEIYIINRLTMRAMYPDGSSATDLDKEDEDYNVDAHGMRYPYKTIDFTVHKLDPDTYELIYMDDGSLDGLAIFVGNNHSFAIRASSCDYPELKPDSIYFTDTHYIQSLDYYDRDKCNYGGHDIGIFNYKDKTFSSCYCPFDYQSIKRMEPAPMWFTPSTTTSPKH